MQRTRGEIEALGRKALVYEADVASYSRAQEVVGEVAAQWGRVDFLLNNAGKSMPKGLMEISEQEWDRTLDINLKSCFNWCRAVVPLMQERGAGRIANMSSLNAHTGGVTSAVSKFAYAAAKAGILGLTRALAKELGPTVHINAICPGVIETELGNSLTRARGTELAEGISLERLGTPKDVANVVAFLATAEPSFMTGQNLVIDGFQWVV